MAHRSYNWLVYAISLALSTAFFGLMNYRHFHRPVTCADCFFPYGLPFTMYRLGGFAGGDGMVWSGLAADILVALGVAAAFAWAWKRFAERHPK